MQYRETIVGELINRDNRFIARVNINGKEERVHVPNTGRCKELFLPNAKVLLSKAEEGSKRKTKYSLVHVEKNKQWINIDSQSPNKLVEEFLTKNPNLPNFGKVLSYRREVKLGDSRIDFQIFGKEKEGFIEVKGVTLEKNGHAFFPDAPTGRGKRHVLELIRSQMQGESSFIFFVVQMKKIHTFTPNWEMDPDFSQALFEAKEAGVEILALDTIIEDDKMHLDKFIDINWNPEIKIERATLQDYQEIEKIYIQANKALKRDGVDQWQKDFPNKETFLKDLDLQASFLYREKEILATAALIPGQDKTYKKIYKGSWVNDEPYTTIHRFAIHDKAKGKGLGKQMLQALMDKSVEMGYWNVRIDTHKDNKKMLRLIESMGFIPCGIIHVMDGSERLAFIKELGNE